MIPNRDIPPKKGGPGKCHREQTTPTVRRRGKGEKVRQELTVAAGDGRN